MSSLDAGLTLLQAIWLLARPPRASLSALQSNSATDGAMSATVLFCEEYQKARPTKGRPCCPYSRADCPHGAHACSTCGRRGHGAADCKTGQRNWQPVPPPARALATNPPQPPPPPSRPPSSQLRTAAGGTTSKSQGCPREAVNPGKGRRAYPKSSSQAPASSGTCPAGSTSGWVTFVPGFGIKGEGKNANYGLAVPAPHALLPPPPSPASATATSAAGGAVLPLPRNLWGGSTSRAPPPYAAPPELVQRWFNEHFKPLPEGMATEWPPPVGSGVLWRGVATGSSGQLGTKVEYFNGKVRAHAWQGDQLFLHVD